MKIRKKTFDFSGYELEQLQFEHFWHAFNDDGYNISTG